MSAIKQALEILSHFYGEAAQATVEEGLIQQPSVEDDAPDAGFDGAYTGAQGSSTGIVGMMEVILGDFERTISDTEELEASQKKEFVDYERETQVSISTKSAALSATSDDLTSTTETIAAEFKEIKTQQGLFDTATKTWEELLPGCVRACLNGVCHLTICTTERLMNVETSSFTNTSISSHINIKQIRK